MIRPRLSALLKHTSFLPLFQDGPLTSGLLLSFFDAFAPRCLQVEASASAPDHLQDQAHKKAKGDSRDHVQSLSTGRKERARPAVPARRAAELRLRVPQQRHHAYDDHHKPLMADVDPVPPGH